MQLRCRLSASHKTCTVRADAMVISSSTQPNDCTIDNQDMLGKAEIVPSTSLKDFHTSALAFHVRDCAHTTDARF